MINLTLFNVQKCKNYHNEFSISAYAYTCLFILFSVPCYLLNGEYEDYITKFFEILNICYFKQI